MRWLCSSLPLFLACTAFPACRQNSISSVSRLRPTTNRLCSPAFTAAATMASSTFQQKTEEEWRQTLTREEYRVLREKATEPAGSGEYDRFTPSSGCFVCRGCLSPLFPASSKFKSGCGWPAFDRAYKGKVKAVLDLSGGMRRWEIICSTCGGHLGHVFNGERFTDTNERHCVNSLSIKYMENEPSPPLETEVLNPEK